MLKKALIFPLLFVWCALHLLTPFAAVCSISCRGVTPASIATPTSHACCLNHLKPRSEIKASPACACPFMLKKPSLTETEVVLAPLEERGKVRPLAFGNGTLLLSAKIAGICFSPPGSPPLYQPDCSGAHSVLRI
jgi:hypothetical protein